MPYVFVNCTKFQTTTGSTCSQSVAATAANALFSVSASFQGNNTTSTVSTSGGGTWALDTGNSGSTFGASGSFFSAGICSCPSATGGSNTITVTNSGAANGVTASVYEFSGNATASIRDATSPAVATGSSTIALTNALTNVTADALFLGMAADANGANPSTVTVNAAGTVGTFTMPANGKDLNGVADQVYGSGYQAVSSVTSNVKVGWTITSSQWAALIAVYKAAASAFPGDDEAGLTYSPLTYWR